ncbi:unnamed protein product [Cyclocybe aegerita]|uniref:Uncharacterized protein n=1 Tax=Cyclocybe aegerita TaxID=1973307 RepID=A0A8S0VUQ7_CYCAE|nr:unnamed protein product [Cyclocybe aegerita]
MATAFSPECTTKGNCEQCKAMLKPPARPGDPAMFLLSTFSVITAGFRARLLFVRPESSRAAVLERFVVRAEACTLVLANWAADLSMMWRCLVVYSTADPSIQTKLTLFLALLSLLSLGSGISYIISAFRVFNVFMIAFSFITATINIIITILIIARLSYHQRYIRKTLGERHSSPYSRLQYILTESTMSIVVFNVAHGVVAWKQKDKYVLVLPHQLLVHIYVISALLVLYRASQRKKSLDTQGQTSIQFSRSFMLSDLLEEHAERENTRESSPLQVDPNCTEHRQPNEDSSNSSIRRQAL